MSSDIRSVNVGTIANDGTGDAIRTAFTTVNDNFGNLDTRISTGNFGVVYSGTYIQANLTLTSLGSTTTETLEVHQSILNVLNWIDPKLIQLILPVDKVNSEIEKAKTI